MADGNGSRNQTGDRDGNETGNPLQLVLGTHGNRPRPRQLTGRETDSRRDGKQTVDGTRNGSRNQKGDRAGNRTENPLQPGPGPHGNHSWDGSRVSNRRSHKRQRKSRRWTGNRRKDQPEAHNSSKAASIFAVSCGESIQRRL